MAKATARRLVPAAALLGLTLSGIPGVAQTTGPVGMWNLETRNLAERATGGVRNVLLRIQETDGRFHAQMTSPRSTFLDVRDFEYQDGRMRVIFGSYSYLLELEGDQLTGTMTSPVDTLSVRGRRQQGTMYAGDTPEEYVSTRTGMLGHRTRLEPPEDETDPGDWVRSRVQSVDDYALILRGIPVSFTNPEEHERQLTELAGRRVSVTGAWIGARYRIDAIEAASEDTR